MAAVSTSAPISTNSVLRAFWVKQRGREGKRATRQSRESWADSLSELRAQRLGPSWLNHAGSPGFFRTPRIYRENSSRQQRCIPRDIGDKDNSCRSVPTRKDDSVECCAGHPNRYLLAFANQVLQRLDSFLQLSE